ncbi:MAG: hypothetical protein JKX67_02365 [Colwellia sp.]|nr:hypothetical protein [Colwellia sp.]
MANKNNYRLIGLSLLLSSPMVWSAAPLTMHIFEDKQKDNTISPVTQVPPLKMHIFTQQKSKAITEQVTKKTIPTSLLKMHVFDNSPTIKNNAVVAERYTRAAPEEREKVALSYVNLASYIKTGYRRDDLNWSIAGPDDSPNILSELTWTDIEMVTISAGTILIFESNWLLNLELLFGRIYHGDNQDSDYLGDNRTLEFSRSNNSGDKGSVLDISVATGYNWTVPFKKYSTYPNIEFRPQIGLSYYSQNLTITDGNKTVSEYINKVPLGLFPGAKTTYDATWFGPWLGLKSKFNLTESFSLSLNLEYHYAKYDSTANWNLRANFAHPESFTQQADGYGLIGDVAGEYKLNTQLSLNLLLRYQDWQAHDNGIDKVFFSDGETFSTKFNGVNWQSFAANIGVVFSF